MSLLELADVTIAYGEVTAARSISFTVRENEAVALIGANGAGKTTILRAISGTTRASNGSISFEGEPISRLTPERVARKGIALVPEGRRIFGSLSVEENLRLGLKARSARRSERQDVEHVLNLFPALRERLGHWAGQLSGGQQQQLALARALVGHPRLLLLDEPSLGLAPQIVDEVFNFLATLRGQGQTILLAEQNAARAVEFADRVYLLQRGRIVLEATAAELAGRMNQIAELYLGSGREASLLEES